MAFVVRPAEMSDAAAMGAIHVAAWQTAYRGTMPDDLLDGLDTAAMGAQWSELLTTPTDGVLANLVAEADGVVVAMATIGDFRDRKADDEPTGELWMLNAHPTAFGAGAATALHAVALARLGEAAHDAAVLWVVEENPRARRFYEREGWVDDGVVAVATIGGAPIIERRYSIALRS